MMEVHPSKCTHETQAKERFEGQDFAYGREWTKEIWRQPTHSTSPRVRQSEMLSGTGAGYEQS